MPEIGYVNGSFCDLSDATISIEDRGFQFADGVYEVFVAYGDRVFKQAEHLARLARSLDGIRLPLDPATLGVEQVIREGIARAGFEETMVYLQVTRGTAARSHVYNDDVTPTVVATFKAKPQVAREKRERGLSVITVPDMRWPYCYIKSIALLPNVLAKNDALRRGYDDAVFVAPDGEVREASAANVFVVRGGVLLTPPGTDFILHGITRAHILDCAARIDLPRDERPITREELSAADEMFISSTTTDVLGVTRVDDRAVGAGQVGPVSRALFDEFRASVARDLA